MGSQSIACSSDLEGGSDDGLWWKVHINMKPPVPAFSWHKTTQLMGSACDIKLMCQPKAQNWLISERWPQVINLVSTNYIISTAIVSSFGNTGLEGNQKRCFWYSFKILS